MKNLILVLFVFASASAFAADYQTIKVDPTANQQESVVLQCDDTLIDGVDLVIPGVPGKDFRVSISADVTSNQLCTVLGRKKNADGTVTYRIRGDDGCDIRVQFRAPKVQTVIEIGDSC